MSPLGQVRPHRMAIVKASVVANHMDLLKAAKSEAEIVQVSQEELSVSPGARRQQKQRPRGMQLLYRL